MASIKLPNGDQAEVIWDYTTSAYTTSTAITPGTPFAAGRTIYYVCTTSGNLTATLASGSTITIPITAGPSLQVLPFAATNIVLSGGAAGTFFSLS